MYREALFPLLKRLDPERAHHLAALGLEYAQATVAGRSVLRRIAGAVPRREIPLCGVIFPNAIGVAAGFDKDVRLAMGLWLLGFGHVEVGTLTPRPQVGNPKPRVFRLPPEHAIINRMGFPNCGVEAALPRLRAFHKNRGREVLGVSLGKQKETPLENAARDYVDVMRRIYPFADYLAVNISSPNTPGLRDLQGGDYLHHLLRTLVDEDNRLGRRYPRRPPLFVKIAPDIDDKDLLPMIDTIVEAGVDGIIATNTTTARPCLRSSEKDETGGLSGRPLTKKSTLTIERISRHTDGKLPIIGVGGIFTPKDVEEKLDAGAGIVQVYTGLVYQGPAMAGEIARAVN